MDKSESVIILRVRYCETDQMGTYSSSRALDWFELARTEMLRRVGLPYARMESRGVMLPVAEAHVNYLGRAAFDDELKMTVTATMIGRARVRFDVRIERTDGGGDVAAGYTIHPFCDPRGKPIRPPAWVLAVLGGAG